MDSAPPIRPGRVVTGMSAVLVPYTTAGGIDWAGHEHAKAWYAAFKSRRSFRPLLAERLSGIEPPNYYENPDF